jgi:amino acid transporter
MISVISFPGGYYGYVRCGMGPLLGFLVGCSGLVESVFFLAVSVLKIGQVFTVAFDMDTSFQPIIWFVVYSIIILFHARGSRLFWQVMKLCTVFSLAIILLYLFGSMPVLNFNKYAEPRDRLEFHTSVTDFLHMLRLPGWFFMGIDMVSLTVEEVNHVRCACWPRWCSSSSRLTVVSLFCICSPKKSSPGRWSASFLR